MDHGWIHIEAAGEEIALTPFRAAYWPARRTLIAADLHFGKAEAFQAMGLPIPDAIALEPLSRLDEAIRHTRAERLIIVGDLLHAPAGMTGQMLERVTEWRRKAPLSITLIPGNHDRLARAVAAIWNLDIAGRELDEGPFRFAHIEGETARGQRFTWSGHLHPCIRMGGRADSAKLPVYLVRARGAILPSFSRFTSGASTRLEAGERAYAIIGDEVCEMNGALATPAPMRV